MYSNAFRCTIVKLQGFVVGGVVVIVVAAAVVVVCVLLNFVTCLLYAQAARKVYSRDGSNKQFLSAAKLRSFRSNLLSLTITAY